MIIVRKGMIEVMFYWLKLLNVAVYNDEEIKLQCSKYSGNFSIYSK